MMFDDYGGFLELQRLEQPKTAIDAFLDVFGPHLELQEKTYTVVVRKNSDAY